MAILALFAKHSGRQVIELKLSIVNNSYCIIAFNIQDGETLLTISIASGVEVRWRIFIVDSLLTKL